MSGEIKNIGASIRQRLKNKARQLNQPFEHALRYYAIERFLNRLAHSKHTAQFILKGGQMLVVWRGERSRPTMDIDLLGFTSNDPEKLEGIFKDLCRQNDPEEDAVLFDPKTVSAERIKEDADYEGVRITFEGRLDTAALHVQVDIGFNDAVTPGPETVSYPSMLDFAEAEIQGYNRETLIAEKYEAMVSLGELNSRMKDFFDIWLLSTKFEFDQERLANALKATFERRRTSIGKLPAMLNNEFTDFAAKQKQWAAFLKRSSIIAAPGQFSEVTKAILSFLGPVVAYANSDGDARFNWWKPAVGWRPKAPST